jgi:hypothetical protein
VFRELQPRLRYTEMGHRGITPMQYFQDFRNVPAPFGYGDAFGGHYEVKLCRSISREERRETGPQDVERLILETNATLTGKPAVAVPPALGFAPALGAPTIAGTGRVLHVLTRPKNPPGHRWVSDIPEELQHLMVHDFEGPYPTIPLLRQIERGFEDAECPRQALSGVWGIANSDVFQHVHAREYTMAMENGIAVALMAARLPLEQYISARARVIFRRPSFVGERYCLNIRLYRRESEVVTLGAFHNGDAMPAEDDRAAVFMRFEGRIG